MDSVGHLGPGTVPTVGWRRDVVHSHSGLAVARDERSGARAPTCIKHINQTEHSTVDRDQTFLRLPRSALQQQHLPMVARTVRSSGSHGRVTRPSRPTDVDVPMSQGLHKQHTRSCHNASSREHHASPSVLGPHKSDTQCEASLLQSWEPSKRGGGVSTPSDTVD